MLRHIWNLLAAAGLGVAAFTWITGKDLSGTPTSTATMDCGVLARKFVGDQMEVGYTLRKIQRVDPLDTLQHDSRTFACLGRAYLEGSPATYVRLSSSERAGGQFDVLIEQAHPDDYNCDLLADEIVMKFSGSPIGGIGIIQEIRDTRVQANTAPIHCTGMAQFDNGLVFPTAYSFDGTDFKVGP